MAESSLPSEIFESITERLKNVPGIMAFRTLTPKERALVLPLESRMNVRDQLLGMRIINEGILEVLSREHVLLIAHSRTLRHPPGSIVVICADGKNVGEEIWDPEELTKLSHDSNAILLGESMVIYRDALAQVRGQPLTITYRALPFPELDELYLITNVVSVTIHPLTHIRLSQIAGWDFNDPDLGTVLIGFNARP